METDSWLTVSKNFLSSGICTAALGFFIELEELTLSDHSLVGKHRFLDNRLELLIRIWL